MKTHLRRRRRLFGSRPRSSGKQHSFQFLSCLKKAEERGGHLVLLGSGCDRVRRRGGSPNLAGLGLMVGFVLQMENPVTLCRQVPCVFIFVEHLRTFWYFLSCVSLIDLVRMWIVKENKDHRMWLVLWHAGRCSHSQDRLKVSVYLNKSSSY